MSKFMLMLKAAENSSAGSPPPALFEAIGKAAQEWSAAGILLDTAGLAPTAMSVRLQLANGEISQSSGPFDEGKEVVSAYAIVEAESQDEAVARATEFLEIHKQHWPEWQGESEIRMIFGAE